MLAADAPAVSERIDMKQGCKTNPQLAGACTKVRGRLSAYDGNPTFRIWPLGSKRMLGVVDDRRKLSIPAPIRTKVTSGHDVHAEFLVCPFTASRPEAMQYVCIEEASHVSIRTRP